MEKLKKIISLAQTKTAKNTYLVFVGNSLAGFIGMVLMIILSRILGPSEFGVFSVSFAFFCLLAKFADLGFNFAMVKDISESRAKNEKEKIKRIFETVFCSKIVISLLIGVLGLFSVEFISKKLFNAPLATGSNRLIILLFLFFVFYDVLRVFFQANKRFLESVLMYISANLMKLILILIFLLFWPKFKNYILIYLIAPFVSALPFLPRILLYVW